MGEDGLCDLSGVLLREAAPSSYRWLAGKEGMESKMKNILLLGITLGLLSRSILSFLLARGKLQA